MYWQSVLLPLHGAKTVATPYFQSALSCGYSFVFTVYRHQILKFLTIPSNQRAAILFSFNSISTSVLFTIFGLIGWLRSEGGHI